MQQNVSQPLEARGALSPASRSEAAPPSGPLTLEDLPDDLLRLCVLGGASCSSALLLRDILSLGMCSRRLRTLVQGGGVVRHLRVLVRKPREDPTDDAFLRPRLSDPTTIEISSELPSLEWLCSLGPLRGLTPQYVNLQLVFHWDRPPLIPLPLPAPWRRLRDLLSPTCVLAVVEGTSPEGAGTSQEGIAAWLEGCPRLDRLLTQSLLIDEVPLFSRLTTVRQLYLGVSEPPTTYPSYETMIEALAPLQKLRDLALHCFPFIHPSECAPLAALSALTALTLLLANWDEPPGPLPPALKNLEINHFPDAQILGPIPHLPLSLAYPLLKPALGAAATSLRHLTIRVRLFSFVQTILAHLTPESAPCAFSRLEEFNIRLYGQGTRGNNSADLVALLEAAPRLRLINLQDIQHISNSTLQWLQVRRQGFRLMYKQGENNAPGTSVLELP
jgi:hypothetical protein